jgi:hypothetical protein
MEHTMPDYDSLLSLDAQGQPWSILVRRVFHRLRVYGCVVLRNALPRGPLETVRAAGVPEARRLSSLTRQTEHLESARADWVGDLRFKSMLTPQGSPDLRHYVIYQIFMPSLMPVIAGAYFKQFRVSALTLPHVTCHMRYQSPQVSSMVTGMHQDGNFTGSMDIGRSVQFWVPLDPCGEDAPGMEFVPVGLSGILPHGDTINVSPSALSMFSPEARFRPVFSPGDVMVFNSETLHGTWSRPEMTKERFNLEFRVFGAGNVDAPLLNEGETRFFAPQIPAPTEPVIRNYILDEPLGPV